MSSEGDTAYLEIGEEKLESLLTQQINKSTRPAGGFWCAALALVLHIRYCRPGGGAESHVASYSRHDHTAGGKPRRSWSATQGFARLCLPPRPPVALPGPSTTLVRSDLVHRCIRLGLPDYHPLRPA